MFEQDLEIKQILKLHYALKGFVLLSNLAYSLFKKISDLLLRAFASASMRAGFEIALRLVISSVITVAAVSGLSLNDF